MKKCKKNETRSLTDYIREDHSDVLEWRCDSDECELARQIERDVLERDVSDGEITRGTKSLQRQFTITQAPEILLIQLKRKQLNAIRGRVRSTKIDSDVPYEEELDLSEFNENRAPLKYRLYGVVARSGSPDGGHYIAAVRRKDNGFATINDNIVRREGDGTWEEMKLVSSRSTVFDSVLLFYLRI